MATWSVCRQKCQMAFGGKLDAQKNPAARTEFCRSDLMNYEKIARFALLAIALEGGVKLP